MDNLMDALFQVLEVVPWVNIFVGLFVFVIGQGLLQALKFVFTKIFKPVVSNRQRRFVLQKFVSYSLNAFLVILVLKIMGVDFKMLLGAAGILTLALGFAARTSISNLISGIFLIFERPFVVGDLVDVEGTLGEVLSIDLLATNLRTLDNLLVRVPNEKVSGTLIKNYSFFPIRRLDLNLMIPYEESLTNIHKLLLTVADRNEMALDEPRPVFRVESFQENHIDIIFAVWTATENFWDFRDILSKEIHRAFKKSGVDQPHANIEVHQPPAPTPGEAPL